MCVSTLGGQKKTLRPLELELQVFGSCPVGAGNWTSMGEQYLLHCHLSRR